MRVNDVEPGRRLLVHITEHRKLEKSTEFGLARQPQRLGASRREFRSSLRVARGKERNLMSATHEFLGDVGNYSFGATVKLRRNSFVQRRYLRDA